MSHKAAPTGVSALQTRVSAPRPGQRRVGANGRSREASGTRRRLAGPHVGPDGIRRPIGNRPVRVFIPFGGAKRHAFGLDYLPHESFGQAKACPTGDVVRPLLLHLMVALAGVTSLGLLFPRFDPSASLRAELTRDQAIAKTRQFATANGVKIDGWKAVAVEAVDTPTGP